MTFHALVVDDNLDVLEEVQDRLESLGHTCDVAETQADARTLLEHKRFSYALLDLEIPVRYGSPCRIVNGKNLLRDIRTAKGFEDMPIIVMTAHGHNSPKLAVEVMKHAGATDFIMKPFSQADPPLERVIDDVLRVTRRDHPGAKSHSQLAQAHLPPQPFEEGEMVFYETRIELCGVKICEGTGSGLVRAILDVLRKKDSRGNFIALSGEELAQQAGGALTRQNDVADAIRRLRRKLETSLLEEVNIRCTRLDVITNDRKYGYRLSSKISVRDADDVNNDPNSRHDDVNNDPNSRRDDVNNDVNTGVSDVNNDVNNQPSDPGNLSNDVKNPNDRQQWILSQLRTKGSMRKDEVFPGYERRFRLSKTTLERDLNGLRRRGVIRFDGKKRTGCWRCV